MCKFKKFLYSTMFLCFVLFGTINVFALPSANNGGTITSNPSTTDDASQGEADPDCQYQARMEALSVEEMSGEYNEETNSFLNVGEASGNADAPSQDTPSTPQIPSFGLDTSDAYKCTEENSRLEAEYGEGGYTLDGLFCCLSFINHYFRPIAYY